MVIFGPHTGEIRNGVVHFKNKNGANAAKAILHGIGTSGDPSLTSAADDKFMEYRCKSSASSGDNRLFYLRYELSGGGGGECIRAFTKLTGASGTVRGAHISLDISSAGSTSGLGVGIDNQIAVFDGALTGGTYAVGNFEIYSAGASTDVSGVTEISFQRFVLGGNTTGAANVDDNAFLFKITGGTIASGNIVEASTTEANYSHSIRVNVNGTTVYLMCASAVG